MVEYSAEAFAAMHAVSRVTCPSDGVDILGQTPNIDNGFFHISTSSGLTTEQFFLEAMQKIGETQCIQSNSGEYSANQRGQRNEQNGWTIQTGETNLNLEGGFCGMPTQDLGTVLTSANNLHRISRFIQITQ